MLKFDRMIWYWKRVKTEEESNSNASLENCHCIQIYNAFMSMRKLFLNLNHLNIGEIVIFNNIKKILKC